MAFLAPLLGGGAAAAGGTTAAAGSLLGRAALAGEGKNLLGSMSRVASFKQGQSDKDSTEPATQISAPSTAEVMSTLGPGK